MSNEWNWHVNSLQTRLNDLQSTIDSIKTCVERRPGLDAATRAIAALIEASAQSENALQEFPVALSQILSDPSIGSLLIGPQGDIVLYNATAEQLLGREYMQDRTVSSVQFSTDDRSKRLLAEELPWALATKGESLPDVRLHLSRPANADIWLNVSATPFRSSQGAVTGAVVFLIDTTEEVQLEGSITSLCDTIHEQISQVGDTQTQLRDLAQRLSGTGIQKLLGDGGTPAPPAPPRSPEDPNRKKSHPRRDATRQVALPQPTKGPDSERVIATPPPLPSARVEPTSETPSADSEVAEDSPTERSATSFDPLEAFTVDKTDSTTSEQESDEDSFAALESPSAPDVTITPSNDIYEEAEAIADDEERNQSESGSWAVVAQEGDRFSDESIELSPVDLVDAQKTLEIEAVDALADPSTVVSIADDSDEIPLDFPSEQSIGELPETSSHQSSELMEESPAAESAPPSRWSSEYSAYENQESEPAAAAPEEETPKKDFWVSGYSPAVEQASAEEAAQPGSEVGDSAKSLFGKFANLTKDSYGETRADEEKEPDPALPWPELVDGQDYGEPLWDEYTQSEEETTPWQQDKVDESEETGGPHKAVQASFAEEASEDYSDVEGVDETAPFAVSDENGEGDIHEAGVDTPGYAAEEVDEFSPLTSSSSTVQPIVASEYAETVQEEYSEPLEVSEFAEQSQVDATVLSTAEAAGDLPTHAEGDEDIHGFAKPTGLKGKPRPSASYNRLKPLAAAADLEGSFLEEGLTEQVVRFSSLESTPEEEGPKKVLVVDDIPVNQKLLLLHLKRLGYEADVAGNGQEALDMLAEKSYQLILMDCDMPVMSGFEAASRIRSNEAYSHRRIPIIALTSYDREGDKEKCIAAGMDDYITKGSSQKELKETIERSFVTAMLKSPDADDEAENEADMAPPDINTMLKMYGKQEVEEISRLFLSNMGTYIESMQFAIDNKDAEQVSHFANAVKGPCAALGMRLMTRLTSDIMAYADSKDWTQVRVKYMRLKAVFVQTREELKKVCPDDSLLAT
ncbi:MAG: response regulator [Candidatus Melainabacteria bacterium]|nr:response regulator [Candidatus Melainabacteria bacterium]